MELGKIIRRAVKAFSDALYLEHIKCLSCGRDLPKLNNNDLCDECRKGLVYNNGKTCVKCGKNVFGNAQYCLICKQNARSFTKARAPFLYCGMIAKLVKKFKYNNAPYMASSLAWWLVNEYIKSDFEVDVVVPVPMHEGKKSVRGYNQAELLAREFCKITKLPIDTTHLIKVENTSTQTAKTREQRMQLEGVYVLTDKKFFKGKRVLLIDDVMTTCSTMSACAEALNASVVYGLALAHTRTRLHCQGLPENLANKKYVAQLSQKEK